MIHFQCSEGLRLRFSRFLISGRIYIIHIAGFAVSAQAALIIALAVQYMLGAKSNRHMI